MGIKSTMQALSQRSKAALLFIAAVVPPVVALFQSHSTDVFLYGAAVLGGVLAVAVKLLSDSEQ